MPNIEVRALDLRAQTATPLLDDRDVISLDQLNYIWVTVRDILTGAETKLRFLIAGGVLLLRSALPTPGVVEQIEAELRMMSAVDSEKLRWCATMIHRPIAGLGQVDSKAMAIGDNLQVDADGDWRELWVKPKVNFGEVIEIVLVAP